MATIFITGSTDGLGQLAAQQLVNEGHQVVLHARNPLRGRQALDKVPKAETVLVGDLSDLNETRQLAEQADAFGKFDAIIHNAGVYHAPGKTLFAVNVLAPYILTSLIALPKRLIYLSSGMHRGGKPLMDISEQNRISYSDSKFQVTTLMKAAARLLPQVYSNAVAPGWVATKMGGPNAPDDLQLGYQTQTWLAVSNDKNALVTGGYFYHQQQQAPQPKTDDISVQERLLKVCEEITGVPFPFGSKGAL